MKVFIYGFREYDETPILNQCRKMFDVEIITSSLPLDERSVDLCSGADYVLTRLASAIGYSQEVPAEAVEFVFKVDGGDVRCLDLEKRLVLMRELSQDEDDLHHLASCCMGRMLREEAMVYWDTQRRAAVLAQEIQASASSHELRIFWLYSNFSGKVIF